METVRERLVVRILSKVLGDCVVCRQCRGLIGFGDKWFSVGKQFAGVKLLLIFSVTSLIATAARARICHNC